MIPIIRRLNKNKLITRESCEEWVLLKRAYIIFEYHAFQELLENPELSNYIKTNCVQSDIYYASNIYRHIKI